MVDRTADIQMDSDYVVIREILNGHIEQFEILIRRHNASLYKIARSYGFNHQDAEDLMQDTHIAAYAALSKFQGNSSYRTWLYRIMMNKCLYKLKYGYFKHELMRDRVGEPGTEAAFVRGNKSTADSLVNSHELNGIVEMSLLNIPLSYRVVFILREVEGFSVGETANLLNISSTNVKVRLSRAKRMLQRQIRKSYSAADIYEFNLVYCDAIVDGILKKIKEFRAKQAH